MKIQILPLTKPLFDIYIQVGTKSYHQHYLHLWKNDDATPYLESSFTHEVLRREESDDNTELFIIQSETDYVGILKIIKKKALEPYLREEALLLEKIYILKEYSGKGIGKKVLRFVEHRAKRLDKKILWLDTMKNGPALKFYLDNGFTILKETPLKFPEVKNNEKEMYVMVKEIVSD